MNNLNWYEFDQNNSGGRFDVNEKLCHRLFIQAESKQDAIYIAEDLGCYWNGVDSGIDCPCCGDRWSKYTSVIDIEKYNKEGFPAYVFDGEHYTTSAEERWNKQYGKYEIVEPPVYQDKYGMIEYIGCIRFYNIE